MLEKYRTKVVTADKAAEAIKSGDWVDFGFGSGFPELMDAALAKRKGAVTDVKIRGGLVYRPSIAVVECDPDHESFDYYSWHLGNAERKQINFKIAETLIAEFVAETQDGCGADIIRFGQGLNAHAF